MMKIRRKNLFVHFMAGLAPDLVVYILLQKWEQWVLVSRTVAGAVCYRGSFISRAVVQMVGDFLLEIRKN